MSARKKDASWIDGRLPYIVLGTFFGYFLSKARATDYDTIVDTFLFRGFTAPADPRNIARGTVLQFPFVEFQLYGVLLVAVVLIAAGLLLFRLKDIRSRGGDRIVFEQAPFEWNQLAGGLLFGAGWALTGACPGTVLGQIGEGKISAVFTALGVLFGMWVYMRFMDETCSDCDG